MATTSNYTVRESVGFWVVSGPDQNTLAQCTSEAAARRVVAGQHAVEAIEALLAAREDQMLTRVEWEAAAAALKEWRGF